MWQYTGKQRPPFAETPAAGQESVWDYPRPPALVRCDKLVEVHSPEGVVARTRNAIRILETASPPTYYLPPDDNQMSRLIRLGGTSSCEWKGSAVYYGLKSHPATAVAWAYPTPTPEFVEIAGFLAFYPSRVACFVDGERVRPQPGGFYGGWLTDEIVGPVKGATGTGHW